MFIEDAEAVSSCSLEILIKTMVRQSKPAISWSHLGPYKRAAREERAWLHSCKMRRLHAIFLFVRSLWFKREMTYLWRAIEWLTIAVRLPRHQEHFCHESISGSMNKRWARARERRRTIQIARMRNHCICSDAGICHSLTFRDTEWILVLYCIHLQ